MTIQSRLHTATLRQLTLAAASACWIIGCGSGSSEHGSLETTQAASKAEGIEKVDPTASPPNDKSGCMNDPQDGKDPPKDTGCVTTTLPGVDATDAKTKAVEICASTGAILTDLSSSSEKAGWLVTCCAAPPVATTECVWLSVGDGNACLSDADLKSDAAQLCSNQKSELFDLFPTNDCAGGSTAAKVECCVPNITAPPPEPKN